MKIRFRTENCKLGKQQDRKYDKNTDSDGYNVEHDDEKDYQHQQIQITTSPTAETSNKALKSTKTSTTTSRPTTESIVRHHQ